MSRHIRNPKPGGASRRSAVAAAAYRSGERLFDSLQGKWFSRAPEDGHDIEHTAILAPEGAPDWATDRHQLWNLVERREVNQTDGKLKKAAQLYREVEITLPRELSREERVGLVEDWVQKTFVADGMIADIAIHNRTASDGQEQPHAHIMLTLRRLEERPDKIAKGLLFGNKERDWNTPDGLYRQLAQAKRTAGLLKNDLRRFGDDGTLAEAERGARFWLEQLRQAEGSDPKDIASMEKKVALLGRLLKQCGPAGTIAASHADADAALKELQKEMPICRWRESWAEAANAALEKAGSAARIDHRTLAAQREEALAAGDLVRAAELDREPQKPMGLMGRIHDAYRQVRENVHSWAAVEMRGKMERAFAGVGKRDPVRLREALLRIQDWTEEVIERFNRTESPDDLVPEVRRGPRP